MRIIPRGYQFWPDHAYDLDAARVRQMYESGFAGCWHDPAAAEAFRLSIESAGGWPNGDAAASAFGLTGSGAGQLVVPYLNLLHLFPGSLPGPAQQCGDCVSHSTKNACLLTMSCDIVSNRPDETTGKVEGPPELPGEGIRQGVLSSEAIYWYRGYNGDGWSCQSAAHVATSKSALWPRKEYADLEIDLTHYSGGNAHRYGSHAPPESFTRAGQQHLIRTATELTGFEQVRDFLANGYGVSSCGGEGWSSQRNEDGVSRRQGGWSHAMAIFGADDRDAVKQKYGEPLVLIQNSWGSWNSGPRTILGTNLQIPEGSFWTRWSEARNRYFVAFSGANGWPRKPLPPYHSVLG